MKTPWLARTIWVDAQVQLMKMLLALIFGLTMAACNPAPKPAVGVVSLPAKVYFDTGSTVVGAEGSKTITQVADLIAKENLKVAITGYTDKTGDLAKNEELAKSRAMAVRDALKTVGVAEANMAMKPPLFVQVGAGGSDAEARRVEINRQ